MDAVDDLVQFLRARLDEDEKTAVGADDSLGRTRRHWSVGPNGEEVLASGFYQMVADVPAGVARHVARHDPARVLAEVDAKRRVLDEYEASAAASGEADEDGYEYADGWAFALQRVVQILALPYADHPNYREAWRPRAED